MQNKDSTNQKGNAWYGQIYITRFNQNSKKDGFRTDWIMWVMTYGRAQPHISLIIKFKLIF